VVADVLMTDRDEYIMLDGRGKAVVLDGDFAPKNETQLPSGLHTGAVIDWPGNVVLSGLLQDPDRFGWLLHLVRFDSLSAVFGISFGPDGGEIGPYDLNALNLRLSTPSQSRFWTASFTLYELTEWDGRGNLLRSLKRRPSWFKEQSRRPFGSPTHAPSASIAGVVTDSEGLVWVFVNVASRRWREAWPKNVPRGTSELPAGLVRDDLLFETIVEAIDPRVNRVVTRTLLPHFVIAALPGPQAAAYEMSDDGIPKIVVRSLDVRR
jgi:hypothetical protein